jgi:uncharacterized caspase-like protein
MSWGDGAADGSKQSDMRPQMTGWRMILTTMALLVFVSTSVGAVQRFAKPHSGASSPCSATEVKQSPHTDTNRVALVIGNFNYPDADTPLAQTGNDACALASALRKDGFDVDLVQNATRNDMQRAIERLEAKVRHDSIVMIYFGGYGVQSGGQNYLIPVDAKIWDEQDVRHVGVGADWLFAGLKSSGAHVRLAVIDASRRNPYERRFRSYSHGLAPIQAGQNALILTSEPPGAVADDWDGSHSPLITALLHEMSSSTRSVEEIFERTRLEVARTTQNQQHPTVSSSLTDDVKLGPAPANATVSSGPNTSLDRRG